MLLKLIAVLCYVVFIAHRYVAYRPFIKSGKVALPLKGG